MPHSKGYGRRDEGRSGDAVSIGAVVDDLLAQEVFSRGMPVAELTKRWPEVVGERLANETAPLSLEDGVLVVGATNGPGGRRRSSCTRRSSSAPTRRSAGGRCAR